MLFNSYVFILLFLPVTLLAYFFLNKLGHDRAAKLILVLASLIFYGYNEIRYVAVIVSSILMNYLLYRLIQRFPAGRKAIVAVGVLGNLLLLGYFKYFDFLLENINLLAGTSFDLLKIALPLGISFFTFQQVSFLVDAGRGECRCESFLDYTLFVTFFPQLVAGPIVSHEEMLPQFAAAENKKLNADNLCAGIQAFSIGLFKKVIVADFFGKIVAYGYGNTAELSALEAFLTIVSYTIQIYYDFSGYCDMASGIALMFNIVLPMNFNSPYKALDIVDFWKRWHMTLTRFLTRYVYYPLGGNRKGNSRTYLNILTVFFLSGLWHGAGYTFLIWGLLHGIANVFCRRFAKTLARIPKWIRWAGNFLFLNLTWIVFRAQSMGQVGLLISRLFQRDLSLSDSLRYDVLQTALIRSINTLCPIRVLLLVLAAIAVAVAVFGKNTAQLISKKSSSPLRLACCIAMFVFCVLSLSGVSTFLYFNF